MLLISVQKILCGLMETGTCHRAECVSENNNLATYSSVLFVFPRSTSYFLNTLAMIHLVIFIEVFFFRENPNCSTGQGGGDPRQQGCEPSPFYCCVLPCPWSVLPLFWLFLIVTFQRNKSHTIKIYPLNAKFSVF